jgi:hypothetical protein
MSDNDQESTRNIESLHHLRQSEEILLSRSPTWSNGIQSRHQRSLESASAPYADVLSSFAQDYESGSRKLTSSFHEESAIPIDKGSSQVSWLWKYWEDDSESLVEAQMSYANIDWEKWLHTYLLSSFLITLFFPIIFLAATNKLASDLSGYSYSQSIYDVYIVSNLYLVFSVSLSKFAQYVPRYLIVLFSISIIAFNITKLALYEDYDVDVYVTVTFLVMVYFSSSSALFITIEKLMSSPRTHRNSSSSNKGQGKYSRVRTDTASENYSIGLGLSSDHVTEALLPPQHQQTTSSYHSSDYRISMKPVNQSANENPDTQLDKQVASKDQAKKRDVKTSINRLFGIAKTEKWYLIYASIALIISATATLAQPLFLGMIIQACSDDDASESSNVSKLTQYTFILFIILAIGSVATSIRGYFYTIIGERLVRRIRKDLFDNLVRQDISFFDINKTGELINRLSSDTAVIQSCLSVNISMGLRAIAMVIVSIILLFITSWKLTLVMMGVVPMLIVAVAFYGRLTKRLTKEYQDALAVAADRGTETISNIRITRSFGAEIFEMWRYAESINKSYALGAKRATAYGIFAGGLLFLANAAILVVVYYGARLVISGELDGK